MGWSCGRVAGRGGRAIREAFDRSGCQQRRVAASLVSKPAQHRSVSAVRRSTKPKTVSAVLRGMDWRAPSSPPQSDPAPGVYFELGGHVGSGQYRRTVSCPRKASSLRTCRDQLPEAAASAAAHRRICSLPSRRSTAPKSPDVMEPGEKLVKRCRSSPHKPGRSRETQLLACQ